MDISDIKKYFDAHTNQRLVVKYAVIGTLSLVVAVGTDALAKGLVSTEYVAFVTVIIAGLNEKLKPLSASSAWPVIGAGKKKTKKK